MNKLNLNTSIFAAICAAILFGVSTPFAKQLTGTSSPLMLAGLLYLGSGLGLVLFRLIKDLKWKSSGLLYREWIWLIGAIIFGGILGPSLLMLGLSQTSAAQTSLLLNLESVFTALVAWVIFKEHTDRRIIFGMVAIVLGGIFLAWPNRISSPNGLSTLIIACACLCWAIDNNLTRKISAADPLFIVSCKGFFSGIVTISLSVIWGTNFPGIDKTIAALIIGFWGYGVSLVLFVLALRGLGTARTGAYFATAPFIGALVAIVIFHEPTSFFLWIAAILMGIGVTIHLTENHIHEHIHEEETHSHSHYHDEHHQHEHPFDWDGKEPHTHTHHHNELHHTHPHFPDIHHRHKH
ncbi:drug/transporter permease [Legionella sainthelensi]|uniref:DMT family transporter n=1 Tax=Legionella sainthelensi TaxID=28087 RepID=UPI000E200A71|nr:DMT family transporter [Legionella sainthelensi]VEB35652.1 drug/transporter permease [Legionella sainthelensi]